MLHVCHFQNYALSFKNSWNHVMETKGFIPFMENKWMTSQVRTSHETCCCVTLWVLLFARYWNSLEFCLTENKYTYYIRSQKVVSIHKDKKKAGSKGTMVYIARIQDAFFYVLHTAHTLWSLCSENCSIQFWARSSNFDWPLLFPVLPLWEECYLKVIIAQYVGCSFGANFRITL